MPGHLCLLRLTEDDYPGTTRLEQWPSWTLPVLKWGQQQGGVVGYSHSGWGLALPDYDVHGNRVPTGRGRAADKLPDYEVPPFDGIGANEFIVTVAHDACDFISSVDTPSIWELNIWYHTLNCGFRSRISGETDFPCIYGERVGLGRVYVQLEPGKLLDFDNWVDGLKDGRSYCGDGLSHVVKFSATSSTGNEKNESVQLGWPGSNGKISQLNIEKPGNVKIETSIAAMLEVEPSATSNWIRRQRLDAKPYWHIERARIGQSRKVKAELIVNGHAVATKDIVADGSMNDISWDVDIEQSSWVAVRILPSVHTNPIFIEVGGKPIRASKKSANWCRQAVDVCWNSKKNQIRQTEKAAAELAYRQAAKIYEKIAAESSEE